eukprot:COSAG01_NODE_31000_length_605_cov_3.721344_1_plen_84_part_00
MTGGGEEDVATLRAENTQLKTELTAKDKELTAKDERIAALEAQLQKLQQPKEGVPPVWISVTYVNQRNTTYLSKRVGSFVQAT